MILLEPLSSILTRRWLRLTCLHSWKRGEEIGVTLNGYMYKFNCTVCDKTIRRTMLYSPISGIIPETYLEKYKKDPLYNLSPLFRKD
jgi:hypothetical protein